MSRGGLGPAWFAVKQARVIGQGADLVYLRYFGKGARGRRRTHTTNDARPRPCGIQSADPDREVAIESCETARMDKALISEIIAFF